MSDRFLFALLLAGSSAPVYFVIQLILGADPVDSLIRSFWFLLVIFAVGVAIDWNKRSRPRKKDASEETDERETP
jgi:hypothetical protein